MTDTTDRQASRLHTVAVVLSSLLIPLPMLIGKVTEAVLDTANPAGVDISQDLAYLREILGFGFGSLGILLLAIVTVFVVIYRRARTLDALKLPALILGLQVVVGVVMLLLEAVISNAGG